MTGKFNMEVSSYFGVGFGIGYTIENGFFILLPFIAFTFEGR